MSIYPTLKRRYWIVVLSAVLVFVMTISVRAQTPTSTTSPSADQPALERLEQTIAALAPIAGGTVGVSALHIETGRQVTFNGDERFPMASVYKVPIAVQLLHRVDLGEVQLDQLIPIQPSDLRAGASLFTENFRQPGVAVSVHNLLDLMLIISDNTASDLLLKLAGGPEAVTDYLRTLGFPDIRVDRPEARLFADAVGITNLPPEEKWSPQLFDQLSAAVSAEVRQQAQKKFVTDPRDTATPQAITTLLSRLYRQEILKPKSNEVLLDAMQRCQTGAARLKGLLPIGTQIAHKTGTSNGGITNDAGIITLPNQAGHVAISVLIKGSSKDDPERERAIAEISRAVYDFFLFQPLIPR